MRDLGHGVRQFSITPFSTTNAYLACGILVDAGTRGAAGMLLDGLRGWGVQAHALTHAHPDHQGASHAVCSALGVPFWVGAGDAAVAAGTAPMVLPANPAARLSQALWTGPPHPVDRVLREGDAVGRYTVIETPGHSPGHVVFWDEAEGVLLLGDVLRNVSFLTLRPGLREPPAVFTPDPAQNRASARKLIGLRPRLVCFGHGPPLRDPDAFDAFLRSLP